MLEAIHATHKPATVEQKRAFTREAVQIFHDVLGTPDGKLRIFFYALDLEDSIAGLLDDNPRADDEEGDT
jgi:hypothetical protein